MVDPDRSNWTVEILADFIEARLNASEELAKSRYEADRAALKASLEACNKRLDAADVFRAQMAEHSAHAVTRTEYEAAIAAQRERTEESLKPINKAISEHGRPNWTLMISMATVALGVLSGCWLLVGLQVNVATTPQVLSLENLRASLTAAQQSEGLMETRIRTLEGMATTGVSADAESRTDRGRLNSRVDELARNIADANAKRRASDAHFSAALVEIETQFCASDIVRNLTHGYDLRIESMLWQVTHPHEKLPTDNTLYPTICNRSTATQASNNYGEVPDDGAN